MRSPTSAVNSAPLSHSVVAYRRWNQLGLALGSKWNALYPLAAFALLFAGVGRGCTKSGRAWSTRELAILRDGLPAFFSLVVRHRPGVCRYLASWLLTSGGYDRDGVPRTPSTPR